MTSLIELFGETLVNKNGEETSTASLAEQDCIGIYFSAHWCPPCRGFTPQLAKLYEKVVGDGKKFSIVFVSSDQDEEAFNEYLNEMPWLAVPYSDRERKATLSKKYKVNGIPSLVFVDKQGKTITTSGREAVSNDPTGADFPWVPPTFRELIGNSFIKSDGTKVDFDSGLKDKTIGLYFSAHWCPPCRGFTPQLAETYKKMMEAGKGKDFEIVFVSSDKDEKSFTEYHNEMPWLALPFSERKAKGQLSSLFDISGIPALIIVDKDGKVVNKNGRSAVGGDKDGANFPWKPAAVNDLSAGADGINETASIVLAMEGMKEAERKTLSAEYESIGQEYAKAAEKSGEDPDFLFFTAKQAGGLADRVRELTKQGDATDAAALMMLDCSDDGAYYVCEAKQIDGDAIRKFIQDFKAKNLERQQLS